MGTISMSSKKTAWHGELEWSYSGGYVTVTMYTWKTDGYPSSATSGANFKATITVGSTTETFYFQQQEASTMTVGSLRVYVSGSEVYISGRVDAPYGVSMYNNPLTGSDSVTLYTPEEEETASPSEMLLGSESLRMGETLNISIQRYNSGCTHQLRYRVTGSSSPVVFATGVGIYHAWQVPDLTRWCTSSLELQVEIGCMTYLNGTYCGETWKTVLVSCPEATKPSCSSSAVMGSTLAITLDQKSSSYTHALHYRLADQTGEIVSEVQTACSWEIPLDLAKLIPTLTKGTCTIVCVTYLNALEVGQKTATLSLSVPDNDETKPAASMVLSPSGDLPEQFAGMYIRGRTGVRAEFTASSEYSRIQDFQLVVDGIAFPGNPAVSAYLNSHGDVTVTGRITDARGYVRELSQVIPVIAYDKPRVIPYPGESTVTATRCDSDGTRNPRGQHLLLRAGRKYTALSTDGGQLNHCQLLYRFKTASGQEFSDFYTLLPETETDSDYVQLVVENAVPELKVNYTVQIEAKDTLGGYSVITVPVAALTIPFHIGRGNTNVAVGKYCDYNRTEAFEIGLTTYFDTGIALRRIFTEGSWEAGTELGSTVADADISAVSLYTLFMAVCAGQPVWLMRLDSGLWGSGIKMTCDGSVMTLDAAPEAVTALYAVL